MKIALIDEDNTKFPNLALMKISAYHKSIGDHVEFFNTNKEYDKIYSSKIFTWTTPTSTSFPSIKGGTGFSLQRKLPIRIELMCPDYQLYDTKHSYGFLTRGCIRKCKWCFVPKKEGMIRKHQDIEDFLRHKSAILMDNNVLASSFGIGQINKIADLGIKVDFNQGLDSRLIDNKIAKLLSKVKWLSPVRLACDSYSQVESIEKAVRLLRWHNVTPRKYFCYVLLTDDIEDCIERIRFLKGLNIDPFVQPYRGTENENPTKLQKQFARWVNHKAIFNTVPWKDYCKK
ncbi:MAG: hypothetical protein PVG39_00710 [Desulfobacteraceae bacterium]